MAVVGGTGEFRGAGGELTVPFINPEIFAFRAPFDLG
jgi:hypothetical protein